MKPRGATKSFAGTMFSAELDRRLLSLQPADLERLRSISLPGVDSDDADRARLAKIVNENQGKEWVEFGERVSHDVFIFTEGHVTVGGLMKLLTASRITVPIAISAAVDLVGVAFLTTSLFLDLSALIGLALIGVGTLVVGVEVASSAEDYLQRERRIRETIGMDLLADD
jgi:hypothetical protein